MMGTHLALHVPGIKVETADMGMDGLDGAFALEHFGPGLEDLGLDGFGLSGRGVVMLFGRRLLTDHHDSGEHREGYT